jgi:hypothetical protein
MARSYNKERWKMRKKQLIAVWLILLMFLSGSAAAKSDKNPVDKPSVKEKANVVLDDSDRQGYYQELKRKIFKCVYKNYSSKELGNVFLDFTVLRNGNLKNVKVDNRKTNASDNLKNMVVKSVRQTSVFLPFPGSLKKYSKLQFNIEISFKTPEQSNN